MQNSGIEVSEAGMDYRFKIQNKIYASLTGAAAKRIQPAYFGGGKGSKILYAAGLSLIYRSPAGPVVFTYARGFNSDYNIQENRDYLFLKAGLKF
jgi:outer membrane protein assembly factor BamA